MVERANRSILQMLRTFVEKKTDWERWLPLMLYAYRTSKHPSTGRLHAFEVMFGRTQGSLVFPGKEQESDGYDLNEYQNQLRQKLAELYEIVEANIAEAAEIQKHARL